MTSTMLTARTLRQAGDDLRRMRMNEGLSPEALGQLVGVSGRTIRRIEAGARPTVRPMFLLASHFGVEVSDLWPM